MTVIKRFLIGVLSCLTLFNLCFTAVSAEESGEEKEPVRIICTSDMLCNSGTLNDIESYYKFLYDFSRNVSSDKKADALILGGDVMGEQMTEDAWRYYSKRLSEVLSEASDTVLYASGNTDYYVGENDGFNSADYINTVMKDRLGELPYWDVYLGKINGVEHPLAYRYYIGGYYFYFLNTAPNDMKGALRYGNYVYAQDALKWIGNKMNADDPNGDKLMFLVAHFPLEGDGNMTGALEPSISDRLTDICSGHSNLIYLYSNNTNAVLNTSEKAIQYNTEGLVLTQEEEESFSLSAQWTFVEYGEGIYSIYNCLNGKYLSVKDGSTLDLQDELSVWNVIQENGRIYITDATGENGLRVSKTGDPVFTLGQATPFELYVRTDNASGTVYKHSYSIESGGVYAIVSDSKYALNTNRFGGILKPIEIRIIGDYLRETARKTSAEGDPGFTAMYMGSASSRNTGVQFLTIDIYEDRVEMSLANYGKDGKVNTLSPYTRNLIEIPPVEIIPGTNNGTGDTSDSFNYKLYLIALGCAAAVGIVIGITSMSITSRRRYFE